MKRKTRSAKAAFGLAALGLGCLVSATASRSNALASGTIGISRNASLAELYAYLQVPPPQVMGGWTPPSFPEECSKDWVVWSDGSADPLPPADGQICVGRWRATNSDRCQLQSVCGCSLNRECQLGRKVTDSCDTSGNCQTALFAKNVSSSQRVAEMDNCRQQARDAAANAAQDGPYHYRWRVTSNSTHNFVCQASHMAATRRVLRDPQCGCETIPVCECAREQLSTPVRLSQVAGAAILEGQNDSEDDLLENTIDCETFQDDGSMAPDARHAALLAGAGAATGASRTAFDHTRRLMHELDMFRLTAGNFMGSALAVPPCGVSGWLTTSSACQAQVPAAAFAVSNNCARLLSSHVVSPTITEEVFGVCTDALLTISDAAYTDPACELEIEEDIAQFATALINKAVPSGANGAAPSRRAPQAREMNQ